MADERISALEGDLSELKQNMKEITQFIREVAKPDEESEELVESQFTSQSLFPNLFRPRQEVVTVADSSAITGEPVTIISASPAGLSLEQISAAQSVLASTNSDGLNTKVVMTPMVARSTVSVMHPVGASGASVFPHSNITTPLGAPVWSGYQGLSNSSAPSTFSSASGHGLGAQRFHSVLQAPYAGVSTAVPSSFNYSSAYPNVGGQVFPPGFQTSYLGASSAVPGSSYTSCPSFGDHRFSTVSQTSYAGASSFPTSSTGVTPFGVQQVAPGFAQQYVPTSIILGSHHVMPSTVPVAPQMSTTDTFFGSRVDKYTKKVEAGPAVDPDLAALVDKSVTNKLSTEGLKELNGQYHRPANTQFLVTPRVNKEVWRLVPESARQHDLTIQGVQNQVVNGMIPLVEGINALPQSCPAVKPLADALELFGHCQMSLNERRRSDLKMHMKGIKELVNKDVPVTAELFGDNIDTEIKKLDVERKLQDSLHSTRRGGVYKEYKPSGSIFSSRFQSFKNKARTFLGRGRGKAAFPHSSAPQGRFPPRKSNQQHRTNRKPAGRGFPAWKK